MTLLRVNMSSLSLRHEDLGENILGGRGLIAKLLTDELDPTCDPLGPGNKFIVCTGILGDTPAPGSGRVSIGGKSPLTGGIKEANSGGTVGRMLAKLGLRGVVIEGKPQPGKWYILKISGNKNELLPAEKYLGMNNYQLADALRKDFGPKIGIMSIGTAGEQGYRTATVQISDPKGNPCRAAARGGLGSVMGSKGIKAIVLDPSGPLKGQYQDKPRFLQAVKKLTAAIKEHPVTGELLPSLGTASLVNLINAVGALPTRNFRSGWFEHAEQISGERLVELQKKRKGKTGYACTPGCVIKCSNIFNDENGEYLTSGLEYETIALNGSNCGVSSLDTLAQIDRICDDLGVDTMETGCALAVCMEAGKLEFGDEKEMFRLIQEMVNGTEFGRILGQGTEFTGKTLGVKRIPTVKGQSLAAYDPRSLKGTGITYAVSPMGADHTCGCTISEENADPHQKEYQIQVSQRLQIETAAYDNLGMCSFTKFCLSEPENWHYLCEMMAAKFGGMWTREKFLELGIRTLALERKFNKAAGLTPDQDRLPDFMYTESLSPGQNRIFDFNQSDLIKATSLWED